MKLLRVAWRNYARNRGRYRVVALAVLLGTATTTVIIGALAGINRTVEAKGARYFAGNVSIQCFYSGGGHSTIADPSFVEAAIAGLPYPTIGFARRTIYYRTDARLFYAGDYEVQRRLIGVEWWLERNFLSGIRLSAGDLPPDGDRSGCLVSAAVARSLSVAVGDRITVFAITDRGRRNTVDLTVAGIYDEASFFGYTTYLHRETLNALLERAPDAVSDYGVFLAQPRHEAEVARHLQATIGGSADTFPIAADRAERDAMRGGSWDGPRYAVVPLSTQVSDVADLLDAISIVSAGIVILFLSIVVIGIANTYAMLVYERRSEIGTLRALGLTRSGTVAVYLFEAAIMGVVASLFGLAVGVALLRAAAAIPFGSGGTAGIFLSGGHIAWELTPAAAILVVAAGLTAAVAGALPPALRAARVPPVDALRDE